LILRSPFVRGIVLLVTLLAGAASVAGAATLDVVGPAGAEVVRDGQVLGTLPLDAPIELPHQQFMIIEVRKPGFRTHQEQVYLQTADSEMTIEVELLAQNRSTAVVSSALLAGTGQFYQGRKTAGSIQMGLQLVAWGSVIYGEYQFKQKRDDYEVLDQQYRDALIADDIAQIREEREAAWSDMEDAKTWRNVSIGAVVAIAAWSAFDAWRGHERFHAGVQPASESLDGTATAQVGLRWQFGGGAR
jgi:hypothetical protein